jgi:hypothetical protein
MQTLANNIKVVTFQKPLALDEDNSPIRTTVVDCHGTAPENFDSALVLVSTGAKGADVTVISVKIQESDNADGSTSATDAEGGAAQTVLENTTTAFQIHRTKRYLVAVVTLTATSTADTVPMSIVAVLNNWALPFPII